MLERYIAAFRIVDIDDKIEHLFDDFPRRRRVGLQDTTLVMDPRTNLDIPITRMSLAPCCSCNLKSQLARYRHFE
jgi:hypothetical protein